MVSIQLIAPASGAHEKLKRQDFRGLQRFHSTDCPSEWGQEKTAMLQEFVDKVSIQLIAPASGALKRRKCSVSIALVCFHSTDCPSEWGPEVFCDNNAGFLEEHG